MAMRFYGFDSKKPEENVEIVVWRYENHESNDSYILNDIYGSSVLGLLEVERVNKKNEHEGDILKNGIFIRLNYDEGEGLSRQTLTKSEVYTIGDYQEQIKEIDIPSFTRALMKKTFPKHWDDIVDKTKFRLTTSKNLYENANSKNGWVKQYNFETRIVNSFQHRIPDTMIFLNFERSYHVRKLFPLEENFPIQYKTIYENLIKDISYCVDEERDIDKLEIIRFLFNKDNDDESTIMLNMNSTTNIRRLNTIINRVNYDKVIETLHTEEETISRIKSLMLDVHKTLHSNQKNHRVGQPADGFSEFKVSIKGVDFTVAHDGIRTNILGENKLVLKGDSVSGGWIKKSDKPILDRALAYILSLGNEHQTLEEKLEGKLLMVM